MKKPDRPFTEFLYHNFLNFHNGFFIEAGANTGYAGSICWYLEHDYGWTGMNIECNPYCFKELVKNRPNCINYEYALSNKQREVEFIFPIDGSGKLFAGQGSIIFKSNHWKKRSIKIIKVKTISLKQIINRSIHLLVLDVEGGEIEALKGMGDIKPSVICVEDDKIDKKKLDKVLNGYNRSSKRYKNNTIYYDYTQ